jgi:HEAT repeat protein
MDNILKLLSHDDANIRRAALRALAFSKNKEAYKDVVPLLKDKFWQVREAAVKYFQAVKAEKILPFFFNRLGTDKIQGRKALLDILSMKSVVEKDTPENKNLEQSLPVKKAMARAIALIDENYLIKPLIKSLKSDNLNMQLAAIAALGNIECEQAVEPLMDALDSDNLSVVISSVVSLGKIKSPKCVEKLIKLAAHKEAQVRLEAIISLNHIKDARAIPTYVKTLADPDLKVKRTAIIALGNTRSEENVDYILNLTSDNEPVIRKSAITSLVNYPGQKVLNTLIDVMDKETHGDILLEAVTVFNKLFPKAEK